MATNKDTIQNAILSKCGKTPPCKRKKRTLAGRVFSGDPKTIAIRTLRLVTIGINRGRNIVKTNHESQQQDTRICKIRGTYQENKDTFFKNKRLTQELSLGQESVVKRERIL